MNRTKYQSIVAISLFTLVLWNSSCFSQGWGEGTVRSHNQPKNWGVAEASRMIGTRVYSPDGGFLGLIRDLMIDRENGDVVLAILSVVPGFRDRFLAVPFIALRQTGINTHQLSFGRKIALTGTDHDPYAYDLERHAETVGVNHIPPKIDTRRVKALYRYYGQTPPWKTFPSGVLSSRKLIGVVVESKDRKWVARLDDLVIDKKNGRIAFLLLNNIPGRDGSSVLVPFEELRKHGDCFVLDISGTKLESAPDFVAPDLSSEQRGEEIYRFFGVEPS
jgi:sporulation protein YlmC with PRC-barrel domain